MQDEPERELDLPSKKIYRDVIVRCRRSDCKTGLEGAGNRVARPFDRGEATPGEGDGAGEMSRMGKDSIGVDFGAGHVFRGSG